MDSLGHHYITIFNVVVFSRFVQTIWKIRSLTIILDKERFYVILSSTRYKADITKQTLCMLAGVKIKKKSSS